MITLTLEKLLEEKKITRYELAKRTGIKFQIIDNYYFQEQPVGKNAN